MAWDVIFAPAVRRQLKQLPKRDRKQIIKAARDLRQMGPSAHAALHYLRLKSSVVTIKGRKRGGRNYYIIRVGDIRMVCTIEGEDISVALICGPTAKR